MLPYVPWKEHHQLLCTMHCQTAAAHVFSPAPIRRQAKQRCRPRAMAIGSTEREEVSLAALECMCPLPYFDSSYTTHHRVAAAACWGQTVIYINKRQSN